MKSTFACRMQLTLLGVAALLGVAGILACRKPAPSAESSQPPAAAPATAPATSPTPPVATTPPAASSAAPGTAPAPGAPGATGAGDAETTAKLAGAQWALRQDEIKNDPDGQWAVSATASSSYNDAKGSDNWSPQQAAGAPDVDNYGDNGKAWAPKTPDGGIEWLDLTYAKPVHAREVRVRESAGSGAVIKVELFDPAGTAHTVWQGNDPTKELNYLELKFAPTDYLANRVKITLATNIVPGWNEIDAVQLVGKP
jgi:hypothetical protein